MAVEVVSMRSQRLSVAERATVVALATAAVGVVIQIAAGAPYPKIPPVFFILLTPALLIGVAAATRA